MCKPGRLPTAPFFSATSTSITAPPWERYDDSADFTLPILDCLLPTRSGRAAGGVGTMTRPFLRGRVDRLVLSDIKGIDDLENGETFVQADITDIGQMEQLLDGADGLIHLGGQSVEADWETVLNLNIVHLGGRIGGLEALDRHMFAVVLGPQSGREQLRPELRVVHPRKRTTFEVDQPWPAVHALDDNS
jgi:hypothetical protein